MSEKHEDDRTRDVVVHLTDEELATLGAWLVGQIADRSVEHIAEDDPEGMEKIWLARSLMAIHMAVRESMGEPPWPEVADLLRKQRELERDLDEGPSPEDLRRLLEEG